MENNSVDKEFSKQKAEKSQSEIQLDLYVQKLIELVNNLKTEKSLNSKILKTSITIRDHYPELSEFVIEMKETTPNPQNPEINLNNLKKHLDSLNALLNKYLLEHSFNRKQNL